VWNFIEINAGSRGGEEKFDEWDSTGHCNSNSTEKNCKTHNTLRHFPKAVDHMKCDDDNIDWSEFKSSVVYTTATDEQ